MVWHGDGLLRATARPAMAVLGGLTLSITVGNKGNKGNIIEKLKELRVMNTLSI